ncbi:hypothetical protein [Streptomyces sp. NBC_01565]|uniref:hypothetical protein n=1 Tax=Streptomyces sp. NBC_01565 TaxID=2975881 RepID=UPI0022590929|nr:hypothetical protein [Streptomyces sp. NBC_01565]MCX4543814.1 hypothetical protein [Streptomyces sp. NBC_01565]
MTAPTREQLLVLADRAERGPLTAAEAARLRQGITALYAGRRAEGNRLAAHGGHEREARRRLLAVRALIRTARQRGARSVPLAVLAGAVHVELQLAAPQARQGA